MRKALIRRSQLLCDKPARFRQQLESDLGHFDCQAHRKGLIPLFRPNVASDLDWSELAELFPTLPFYDYTKVQSCLSAVCRRHIDRPYAMDVSQLAQESADSFQQKMFGRLKQHANETPKSRRTMKPSRFGTSVKCVGLVHLCELATDANHGGLSNREQSDCPEIDGGAVIESGLAGLTSSSIPR
ncbi:MAG: GP88 family protein [Aeoliella sp.]